MNRRVFLVSGGFASMKGFRLNSATASQAFADATQPINGGRGRAPVLVPSGFTRSADGTNRAAFNQIGMFDIEVVRSSDSDGRLAAFVFPPADHHPFHGAPLHVHHQQDEWLYILAGEFVAEVGGKRMRLKIGDSLLMPMQVPHRWSVAQELHCGAIHLYSPAGLMEANWSPVAQDSDPKNQQARKAEFERHGLTLLGEPLTKEEIEGTM